jgi:hypothetical protein
MLGEKKTTKEAWDALAAMRIGSERAKKVKALVWFWLIDKT